MKFGNITIGGMSFGSTRIGGAKYGNTLVFQSGGVTPGRLPSGYTEIEYIENPSTAIIDTGISGASSWSFKAQLTGTISGNACVFGSSTTGGHFFAVIYSQSLKWGLGASAGQYSSVAATKKTNIEVDVVSYRQMDVRIGSESITRTGTDDVTGNLLLFAADTTGSYTFPGRFYGDVVGTKNGAEVFHGVPCTNPNNVAGLYDLVSATFFPSSSNVSFLAGLPLSCTPVEYIETDGTAYIDTGISGSIPRSFEMRITPMPVSSEYYFAGVRESVSSKMYPLLISSGKTAGYSFNSGAYSPTSIATSIDNRSPMDVRTHIRSGSQQIGIKQAGESSYTNYSKTATGSFTTTHKIFLFTVNSNGSPFVAPCAGVRLHSVKIYMDSTYTTAYFDGQPCIYNGEYGLWDRISGTFFGNAAASGAFTGPSAKVYDWSNLTWLLVGDSLTELNYRAKTHYFNYVNDLTGISFVNKGSSGKGYANGDYFYSVFNNLSGINFSFATIFGSGNDIRYEAISSLSSAASWTAALGDINDNGTSTICGYINRALDKFASVAPSKKIGIVTPTPWKNGSAGNVSLTDEETNTGLRTYSEKLVLIAQARGIPYLDLFNNSGLDPWDEDFRIAYYNEDGVQDPGVHPNSEGHRVFLANPFLSFLAQNLV